MTDDQITRERAAAPMTLHARSYAVGDTNITIDWRGPDSWAICQSGFCLASDGEWEWESAPSSRGEAYIARTRFSMGEAARRAMIAASPKPGETM